MSITEQYKTLRTSAASTRLPVPWSVSPVMIVSSFSTPSCTAPRTSWTPTPLGSASLSPRTAFR